MPYDPTIYQGSAAYYVPGRPAYSRLLVPTLATELGLDGSGRLLDVGCGPGVLAIALAGSFAEVIALDPDAEMLAEGARRAVDAGIANIRWVQALAEELATLEHGRFRLVTFGQSFHWTDRERVAEVIYDLLEPGGALALVTHMHAGRPAPSSPGEPPIPHDLMQALIERYLGPQRRAGQGFAAPSADRHEDALARTRFGVPRQIFCPGRPDIIQDIDGVLANYLSTSFAAPHLFGDQRAQFEADVRAELAARSPRGLFWDWPGDTAILIADKPKEYTMQTYDDDLSRFEAHGAAPLPVTDEQGYVEHDAARIWYATYGSGPPVILLHGGLGHSGNWGYQVPALLSSGYRAIVIDSRGHGRSTRDARPFTYELLAADVAAVMDALQLEQAALVGWSDGACTALILAAQAPTRVSGVFFFACNMDPSGTKQSIAFTPILKRCIGRHTQDYAQLSTTPDQFDALSDAVGRMQKTQPNYSAQDLAQISVPVAIVQSEHDEFIEREHAEYLARSIPDAEFIELAGVSHFAPLQRPAQFNSAMLAFLGKVLV